MQLLPRVLISWLLFAATIVVNAMANALPINGLNTGQVSALYPNAFVPDGATFGIWSIIYAWLLAYLIYATLLATKPGSAAPNKAFVQATAPLFWVSCMLNASWILAWHYLQTWLSLLIMLLLLITLLRYFLRYQQAKQELTPAGIWLLAIPFVIYLAWICVAIIANTTAVLVDAGWSGGPVSQPVWAALLIGVAMILALIMSMGLKQPAFALVVAWALWGIYRGQHSTYPLVGQAASTGAVLCAMAALLPFGKRLSRQSPR
jgi:hypothetical protein